MLMIEQDKLNELVIRFDRMGLTVKFHAAGDAAVHAALDAIEAARRANGHTGLLHNPGHNSFVQMSDIPRVRELGAAFEFSPYIWFRSPMIEDIEKAVKPELMQRWISHQGCAGCRRPFRARLRLGCGPIRKSVDCPGNIGDTAGPRRCR
jgi:predicted amidohydrolase YtcJ